MTCYLTAPIHYLNQCCLIISHAMTMKMIMTLQWRHNGCDGIANHQPHDCLFNCLVRRRSKKTSKLRVTGLCAGNSPVTGEFPAQMASNAEKVSIWWRHHDSNNYNLFESHIFKIKATFFRDQWVKSYHIIRWWFHPLQWRHNKHHGVSNHQQLDGLFNYLF